jgi:hypothetical protein
MAYVNAPNNTILFSIVVHPDDLMSTKQNRGATWLKSCPWKTRQVDHQLHPEQADKQDKQPMRNKKPSAMEARAASMQVITSSVSTREANSIGISDLDKLAY